MHLAWLLPFLDPPLVDDDSAVRRELGFGPRKRTSLCASGAVRCESPALAGPVGCGSAVPIVEPPAQDRCNGAQSVLAKPPLASVCGPSWRSLSTAAKSGGPLRSVCS